MTGVNVADGIEDFSVEVEASLERINNLEDLQIAVSEGLFVKKDFLCEIGKLPSLADYHAIGSYVDGFFTALRNKADSIAAECPDGLIDIEKVEKTRECGQVKYLLHLAGVAWPITLMDWKVNRTSEADNALGLRSSEAMEMKLMSKYGYERALHLHKGPGDGSMMRQLRKDGFCEQLGLADRPWFLINKALRDFIWKDCILDPELVDSFVELLASLIGRELRDRWFEGSSNEIRKLKPKVEFFDLNEIYGLLADTRWIDKRTIIKNARVIASAEFEDDSEKPIDLRVYEMLLNYLGYSEDEINDLLLEQKSVAFSEERAQLRDKSREVVAFVRRFRAQLHAHRREANTRAKKGQLMYDFPISDWVNRWVALGGDSALKVDLDVEQVLSDMRAKKAELKEAISTLKKKEKADFQSEASDGGLIETVSIARRDSDVIDRIFTREFIDEVNKHRGEYYSYYDTPYYQQVENVDPPPHSADLNRHIDFNFHGMVWGDFVDMDQKFPEKMFLYIDASRSDAHEMNGEFKEDVHRSLKLLAPGGVLLSEGIMSSYDRTPRFREIWEIFEENPELKDKFKVEVVLDAGTNKPRALMIQRNHQNGYLTKEDKDEVFITDANAPNEVSFASLEEVMSNDYWQIISRTRRKVLKAVEGNKKIFRKLNDRLEEKLDDLFFKSALPNWYKLYSIDDQDESKKLDTLRSMLNLGSVREVRAMVLACVRSPDAQDRLLASVDIDSVRAKFHQDVAKAIRQQADISVLAFHEGSLETLDVAHMHVIPRLGFVAKGYNDHCRVKAKDRPNNHAFTSERSKTRLDSKLNLLKGTLRDLKEQLGHEPILLMEFPDCSVGNLMKEMLLRLLGPRDFDRFVRVVSVHFDTDPKDKHLLIRNQDRVDRIVNKYTKKGGIVLGVGSWFNSYDKFGKFFKHKIGEKIFDAVKEKDSKLRVLGICFFEQIMADLVGKEFYGEGRLATIPGSLEMGPVGMHIDLTDHPLFEDCPQEMLVAMTHGSHVKVSPSIMRHIDPAKFVPLAHSMATGLPIAYEALNGKIYGVQLHPEIRIVDEEEEAKLSNDVNVTMDDIEGSVDDLSKVFGIADSSIIWNNWKTAVNTDSEYVVQANGGEHLLVNGLGALSNDLWEQSRDAA